MLLKVPIHARRSVRRRLLFAGLAAMLGFGGTIGIVGSLVGSGPSTATVFTCVTPGVGLAKGDVVLEEPAHTTKSPTAGVARHADEISYRVTVEVPTFTHCTLQTGHVKITLPNGTTNKLTTSLTLSAGQTKTWAETTPSTTPTHVVTTAHAATLEYIVTTANRGNTGAPTGNVRATASVTGTETSSGHVQGVTASGDITVAVIHPDTTITKSASPLAGAIPLKVTYTFNETNISTRTDPTATRTSTTATKAKNGALFFTKDTLSTVKVTDVGTNFTACTPKFTKTNTATHHPATATKALTTTGLAPGVTWTYTCTTTFKTATTTTGFTDHATATGTAGDGRPSGTSASKGDPATELSTKVTVKPSKNTPRITTTPEPKSATTATTILADKVTVTRLFNPKSGTTAGTLTVWLFKPGETTCTAAKTASFVAYTNTVKVTPVTATATTATRSAFTHTFTSAVKTTLAGTWHWKATYTGDKNNKAVTSTCVKEPVNVKLATITVTKLDTPGTGVAVNPGGTIKYTLAVTNNGTTKGTDTITDTVPSNTTLVATSAKCPTAATLPATGACTVTSGVTPLKFTVTVPAGQTIDVTFSVTVKGTDTTTVFNHASFTGPGCPTTPHCTTNTVTNPVPNITVKKLDTPGTGVAVARGGTIIYTLVAHNAGTAAGTDTIQDVVPSNANLVATSAACKTVPTTGSCTVTSSVTPLGWMVTVPAGGTVSVTFKVTVKTTDTTTVFNHGTYTGPGCLTTPHCTTNIVTNPVIIPAAKTLTPGYWKNHLGTTATKTCSPKHPTTPCVAEFLPIKLGNYTVATTGEAFSVLSDLACRTTGINCLAGQLLAVRLNLANHTTGVCIAPVVAKATKLLKTVGYHGPATYTVTATQTARAKRLAAKLSLYNSTGIC